MPDGPLAPNQRVIGPEGPTRLHHTPQGLWQFLCYLARPLQPGHPPLQRLRPHWQLWHPPLQPPRSGGTYPAAPPSPGTCRCSAGKPLRSPGTS
jgi:hypothetical protein